MLTSRPYFLVLLIMLLTDAARALPYELAVGSNTHLTIRVTASDGFTTEKAIDEEPKAIDFGSASSDAFVQGILTPTLFVENLDVSYDPMTFAGTIGVTAIPVSITFNEVSLSYEPSYLGTLNSTGAALNVSQNIVANALSGSLSGFLNADGVVVPFSFSSENFCTQQSYGCWPGTVVDDPSRPKVKPLDNFDRFLLNVGVFNGMRTVIVNQETIADVGGITYKLGVWSTASGSLLQVIPEPSTFLLLACGLAGLAAAGRRRVERIGDWLEVE